MLTHRNFPKHVESLQFPKLKSKQIEPRKKKNEDRYSVYKISQERNKLKKLKWVKSASPIRNSWNYYDITVKPFVQSPLSSHFMKLEKFR